MQQQHVCLAMVYNLLARVKDLKRIKHTENLKAAYLYMIPHVPCMQGVTTESSGTRKWV